MIAVPPNVAAALVPGLAAPEDSRPIVNGHIRLAQAPPLAPAQAIRAKASATVVSTNRHRPWPSAATAASQLP